MRNFKFRVYEPVTDEMYYVGDLAQLVFGMETDWGLWSSEGLICDETDAYLMQYTGLKDKNEKEIYEGDVLKFEHLKGYSDDCQVVSMEKWCWGTSEYSFYEIVEREYIFEVIGNIHENPELL